jgi:hypothetical protein
MDYRAIDLPRLGKYVALLDGADVDMYGDDTYLIGLVESFIQTGRVNEAFIDLDTSIDRRLENAAPQSDGARSTLDAFRSFRRRMVELARALSQASGVPIQSYDREQALGEWRVSGESDE